MWVLSHKLINYFRWGACPRIAPSRAKPSGDLLDLVASTAKITRGPTIVNDNVLYRSLNWIAHFDALGCRYCFDYLGLAHEMESIPLTEYFPIFRVPEYSKSRRRSGSVTGSDGMDLGILK
jgi:hypothetical protein